MNLTQIPNQGVPCSTKRQGEAETAKALLWPAERRAMEGEAGARAKQDCAAKGPFWNAQRPERSEGEGHGRPASIMVRVPP